MELISGQIFDKIYRLSESSNSPMKPHLAAVLSLALLTNLLYAADPSPSADGVPAAFEKDSVILFQGDSITDGNRGRGADPNHILGHGYAFVIAAKYGAAIPEQNLNFMNRGISGNRVTDLQKRWQTDTLDLKPDLLSILIGVNDNSGVPFDQYEQIYDTLLTETKAARPQVRLVLCEPFTLPHKKWSDPAAWESWNNGIKTRQEIVAKLAKKHEAALVKFQSAFDRACERAPAEYWIWDGVHPTYSGHQIMADEWIRAVKERWPRYSPRGQN